MSVDRDGGKEKNILSELMNRIYIYERRYRVMKVHGVFGMPSWIKLVDERVGIMEWGEVKMEVLLWRVLNAILKVGCLCYWQGSYQRLYVRVMWLNIFGR